MSKITHGIAEVPMSLFLTFEKQPLLELPLQELPCRQVVRSLALALLDQTNGLGPIKSRWTAIQYYRAIRRFAMWLDKQHFTGGLNDLSVDDFYEFARNEDSRVEHSLRALLGAAVPAANVDRPVSKELAAHLTGSPLSTRRRSMPLPAYSVGEYDRMVSSCREEIASWRERRGSFTIPAQLVLAFRILIGLELGIPPECINELSVQDLRWQGEQDIRVYYIKRRANGPQSMSYRGKGPWSAPMLLKQWLALTQHLRTASGLDAVWVWQKIDGSIEQLRFADNYWQGKRRAILREWDLLDDNGNRLLLDLRRLRTTWTVRKAKVWHGAVTVDPNRTARVEGDHYLTRSADADGVDTLVEAAQTDLLRRAKAVALVVSDDAAIADAVDDPRLIRQRKPRVDNRQWDMFAAFCRDPYDSPFNPKGKFCTATVWSCLVCPLAIITPGKLPALIRLEHYLSEQSANLTQDEWLRIYGAPWVQLITRIYPQFSESAIGAARAAVEGSSFPLPTEPWEAPS